MNNDIITPSNTSTSNKADIQKNNFFTYVLFDHDIRQGWKIHISALLSNFQEILDTVSDYCTNNIISFKYINNINELKVFLSGDAPYTQLGKFITIYPKNKLSFKNIVINLYSKLSNFKGPAIISDTSYKKSIVHYRYGLFEDDGISYLISPSGEWVEDNKGFYIVPSFEEEPFPNSIHEKTEVIWEKVIPTSIVHFSASGNVYNAEFEGKNVILKEAKNFVTSVNKTAIGDLKNESAILRSLNSNGIPCPKLLFDFHENDDYFIICEKIVGQTLDFYRLENLSYDDYLVVFKKLIKLLLEIHGQGVIVNDISSSNIIVTNNNEVYFVDFGSSFKESDKHRSLTFGATKTFYDDRIQNLSPKNGDFHKLGYLFMNLIFPINSFNNFDSTGKTTLDKFKIYCSSSGLDNLYEIVYLLITQGDSIWFKHVCQLLNEDKKSSTPNNSDKGNHCKSLDILLKTYTDTLNSMMTSLDNLDSFRLTINASKVLNTKGKINIKTLIKFIDVSNNWEVVPKLHKLIENNLLMDWFQIEPNWSIKNGILGGGLYFIYFSEHFTNREKNEIHNVIEQRFYSKPLPEFDSSELLDIATYYMLNFYNHSNKKNLDIVEKILHVLNNRISAVSSDNSTINQDYFILRPYISNGLSGFFQLAIHLYHQTDYENKATVLENLILANSKLLNSVDWCQYSGLLNGGIGVGITLIDIGIIKKDKKIIEQGTKVIVNSTKLDILSDTLQIPLNLEKSKPDMTFSNGLLGNIYGLKYVLERLYPYERFLT